MDYVLLSAEETAQLLNVASEEIIARVEAGDLGGMRVAGHWKIPLKTVAQLMASRAVENLPAQFDELFNDQVLWDRIFSAHPELSRPRKADEKSPGGVRAYLRNAVEQALATTGKGSGGNS